MSINISGTITPEVDVSYHDHEIEVGVDSPFDLIELGEQSGISEEEILEYIMEGGIMNHLDIDTVISWVEDMAQPSEQAKIARVAVAALHNSLLHEVSKSQISQPQTVSVPINSPHP